MLHSRSFSLALFLSVLLQPPGASGADVDTSVRPVLHAVRTATPPTLDGKVRDDPAWSQATFSSDFVQSSPDEGEPASERTEIAVVFDDETLYVGVVCFDREPRNIVVAEARRDASLDETDSIQLILDTYTDRQGGFVFGTSPAGIEFDGQVTGKTSVGMSTGNDFNGNWDTAWEVRTYVADHGWSAEFAIPFRSLRFPRNADGAWGLNVQRNIRRRNEVSFWAPMPRQFNLFWVPLAGSLAGLETPSQRTVQVTPYALVEGRRDRHEEADEDSDSEFGVDVKVGLTPSLTLDATLNTDFAQVEADEQQVNLDRFNLFFPEKRPFFLENAGLFSVGVSGETELFFSRRIGLGARGEAIPIQGGLRVSGKSGRHNIGILAMRADAVEGVAPTNDFFVGRYSRDLANRSSLGVIAVGRRGHGRFAPEDDENTTVGVDGRWGIGQSTTLDGFVAKTDTPGLDGDDHAFRFGGRYSSEAWSASAFYTEVGENFNPEVGFLRRKGYRKPEVFVLYRYRPKNFWNLQEIRPHISSSTHWDFDGFHETSFTHVDNHWEFENGSEVHTGVNFRHEGVRQAFEIAEGVFVPAGSYDDEEAQIVFLTNQSAPWSFQTRVVAGGFFGGDRLAVTPEVRMRVHDTFDAEIEWAYNDIDLPGGAFEVNLGRLRLGYSFTPRIYLQGLVQYNDRADEWAMNVRFAWLQKANTGLFIVYNEIQDIGRAGTGIPGRSLILKYSRLLDFFQGESKGEHGS